MAGLDGKVALVTGAGGMRGVGRAAALKLAGLGADLALSGCEAGGGGSAAGRSAPGMGRH